MINCLSVSQLETFFNLLAGYVDQIGEATYVVKSEAGAVIWSLADSGLYCVVTDKIWVM